MPALLLVAVGLAGCNQPSSTASAPPPSAPTVQPAAAKAAPLTLSGAASGTVSTGQTYSFTPQVGNAGGNRVTFTIAHAPGWAKFNSATGTLSGAPGTQDVGAYANIVIAASDGSSSATLAPFNITVVESGTATGSADVSWTPPTTNTDGSTLTNLAGYRIYYGTSAGALTQSIDVSNIGVTDYVIGGLAQGTWYFAVAAYTSTGLESTLSNVATKTIT